MKNFLPAIILSFSLSSEVNPANRHNLKHARRKPAAIPPTPFPSSAPMVPASPSRFYSRDVVIITEVVKSDYVFEAVAAMVFATQEESTVPFYRLGNAAGEYSFWTTNTTERDAAIKAGFLLVTSDQSYIYPTQICGSVPFYRVSGSGGKDTVYTTSDSERLQFVSQGFVDLGIAGYVLPFDAIQCSLLRMKTSVISLILGAFAVVTQAPAPVLGVEGPATLNSRTEATCGDVSDLAPFAELYIASITAHIYTIYDNNVTNIMFGNPGTQYLGIAALIFSIQDTSTVPFYCLRNNAASAYFYTANETEREAARASGYADLFTAGYIYPSQICGSVPLYRLHFLGANSDYIYTTSVTERENAITSGFTYEGIAGYVYDLLSCGILS
ncbi:hypothetical protein MSAN_00296000 [Mycena sanguinolenta]|uniref:DUF5648 domain-containing protein n=1 Tax=Mycena sanguinolenta TaxID=230812 RepID=A0A8H6ZC40_9AGAR|nr:hypothetical protein MSAN_00296000 [Mycena sanguinolenta]